MIITIVMLTAIILVCCIYPFRLFDTDTVEFFISVWIKYEYIVIIFLLLLYFTCKGNVTRLIYCKYLYTGSAKSLFLENAYKKLLNIFSNFFLYLKVQSFRLIMEYNFIQMAAYAVAYTIGPIFKHIIVCVSCISPITSRILSFKASIVSGLSA